MPSVSGRQHRFFGFLKSHPEEAAKKHVSMGVVNEFLHADKGMHFQAGGLVLDSQKELPRALPRFMRRNFYSGR
jgi:hypothetical protein